MTDLTKPTVSQPDYDERQKLKRYEPPHMPVYPYYDASEVDDVIGEYQAREQRLRDALKKLLEDTQHSEHRCKDDDCPVRNAKAILNKGQSKPST